MQTHNFRLGMFKPHARWLPLLATVFLLFMMTLPASAASTVTVDKLNGDWGFFEEVPNAVGSFVTGPAPAPLGVGSARFAPDNNGRLILGTLNYAGTRLDAFDQIEYSSYRESGGAALAVSLQFDMDYDLTDSYTAWQSRLVYEPYYDNTVNTGAWQTWDAYNGRWWQAANTTSSAPHVGDTPAAIQCPISNPCDIATLLTHYPDAGIRESVGFLQFKAGGPWANFVGYADALTLSVSGNATTFDFEPIPPCTTTCYVDAATGDDTNSGTAGDPFATIQQGLDTVDVAGTVIVAAGTYPETLDVSQAVTLTGAGAGSTIIDASAINDYSIDVTVSDVTLDGFTLNGYPNSGAAYGIKIAGSSPSQIGNITVQNITVDNAYRTGVDLNGVVGAFIDNVTVTNVVSGNGFALTDSSDITAQNITTSNNAWGGFAIYTFGRYFPLGSDNITITGTNSFGEDNKVYVQVGNYNDPANPAPVTNLAVDGFDYIVRNDTFRAEGPAFTFYQINRTDAVAYALALATPYDSYANELATGAFWVGSDVSSSMGIQTAIDKAADGDTINVLPGTYNEIAEDRPQSGIGTGPYDFGLYVGKSALTIQGVNNGGTPITNYNSADLPAVISTAASAFGTQGPFISGNGITMTGLDITPVAPGNNKNVEVTGDNFTLMHSRVRMDAVASGSAVYISDFDFSGDDVSGTTTVTSFNISNNWFDGGTLVIANGAGFGSPISDLLITNNLFKDGGNWAISFNGALDGIAWLNHPVGVPTITGNTFDGNFGNVRFIGTYDTYPASYWNDIIFNNSNTFVDSWVVAYDGTGPDLRATELYNYTTRRQIASSVTTIQNEADRALSGDTVQVGPGTFNEQVEIATDGITLNGSGPAQTLLIAAVACTNTMNSSATAGVRLLGDHSNISLANFSVSGYDLGLDIGENIGKTISNVSISNVTASNNCVHGILSQAGDTDGVTVSNVTANNNGVGFNAGRGLWLINGTKANISITDSEFNDNRLVGIDISDGDVTGLSISGNMVAGNGDSGIGVLGPQGPDANLVANNTVTDNGRFGIEIKNPSGTTTVSGNAVSLTGPGSDTRDYAGIGVFRRGPGATNADQPSGVTVTGNTVTGFVEPNGDGEGFGIVIEGTGMTVTDNVVTGNDVGIQVQEGNPSGANGTPFFDRGDASVIADALVTNNDITGNGDGMRAIGTTEITDATLNWWGDASGPSGEGSGSGDSVSTMVAFCPWLTDSISGSPLTNGGIAAQNVNTGEQFCGIQAAIDDPDTLAGHTIEVFPGTYSEQISIDKPLTLQGPNTGITACSVSRSSEAVLNGVITFTNLPDNVTITGLQFDNASSASTDGVINANGAGNNLTVSYNLFTDVQEFAAVVHGTETIGQNVRTGWVVDQNKVQGMAVANASALFLWWLDDLQVTDNCIDDISYGALQTNQTTNALIDGNTISNTVKQGIQIGPNSGNIAITNNIINSTNTAGDADRGGIRVYGGALTGALTVEYNIITNSFNGVAIRDGEDITSADIIVTRNSVDTTNTNAGIYNGGTGTLAGTCNWWGDTSGPSGEGTGTGSAVSTDVAFLPWLQSDDLINDPCVGGISGITIVKEINPTSATNVNFGFDAGNLGTFSLTGGQSQPFTDLLPGEYTFTETTYPGNWDLTGITCEGGAFTTDLDTDSVTVTLGPDENIVCTFTNERKPQLRVLKYEDINLDGTQQSENGENGLPGWEISIFLNDVQQQSTKTTDANGTVAFTSLQPGATYAVCETAQTGWINTNANTYEDNGLICQDVTVNYGEVVPVSFGNADDGSVTIIKQSNPVADWLTWEFDGDFGPFMLDLNASDATYESSITFSDVALSTGYTVNETNLPGNWDVTDITCDAGQFSTDLENASVTLVLTESAQHVTCTFVNERLPQLQVLKYNDLNLNGTQDADAGEIGLVDWEISIFLNGAQQQSTKLTNTHGMVAFTSLQPGATYAVCETQQEGWLNTEPGVASVDGLVCQDVTVNYGEVVPVVFGNVLPEGSLAVQKYIDVDRDGVYDSQTSDITGENWLMTVYQNNVEITSGLTNATGQIIFTELPVGTYEVCEEDRDGYIPLSGLCQNVEVTTTGQTPLPLAFLNQVEAPSERISPVVECVIDNYDGSYLARFGYDNHNDETITIPVGANNFFTPNSLNSSLPTDFLPGRQYAAFAVTFDGSNLVWTLNGPDGQTRTATASSNTQRCSDQPPPPREDVSPILECVTDLGSGQYRAYFGYNNANTELVSIPVGDANKITGGGLAGQNQGQPTDFMPGRTPFWPNAAFAVDFNGSNTVWTLDGRTATASANSQQCAYHITIDKVWNGSDAPAEAISGLIVATSGGNTVTCDWTGSALTCDGTLDVPANSDLDGTFMVTEPGLPADWTPASGTGEIIIDGPTADKNITHVVTNDYTPSTSCNGPLHQEAEDGAITGRFEILEDPAASNGYYITSRRSINYTGPQATDTHATYCFTVTEAGTYQIEGRVYAEDNVSDSFWVSFNGQVFLWDFPFVGSYVDALVSDRGGMNPVEIYLPAGDVEVKFSMRERNARLDTVKLIPVGGTSNTPPIADAGTDIIVTDSDNNGMETVMLDGSASFDSDGTITSYQWSATGVTIPDGPTPSADFPLGTHTVTLTVTDTMGATATDTVIVTVDVPVVNTCNGPLVQEGEEAMLAGNFAISSDPAASGGAYISVERGVNYTGPADTTSKATFCFTVPQAGTYQIIGTVYAQTDVNDSFWVEVAGITALWDFPFINTYVQDHVSNRGGPDPVTVNLPAGDVYVTFSLREHSGRLDKVELVPAPSALVTTADSFARSAPAVPANLSVGMNMLSWTATPGAHWYQVWIGYGSETYVQEWIVSDMLGCQAGGVCTFVPTLTTGSRAGGITGDMQWAVQAYGPGGVSIGGTNGWAVGPVIDWFSGAPLPGNDPTPIDPVDPGDPVDQPSRAGDDGPQDPPTDTPQTRG